MLKSVGTVLWVDLTCDCLEKVTLALFVGMLLETGAKQPLVVPCGTMTWCLTNDLTELVLCLQLYWLAIVNTLRNALIKNQAIILELALAIAE